MSKFFRIALVQLCTTPDKSTNLLTAFQHISTAAKQGGAQLIVLPECFNAPYGVQYFEKYAESIPQGETCQMLREAAEKNQVTIVGGSIPERDSLGKLYNTSVTFGPQGRLLAQHRKVRRLRTVSQVSSYQVHLFDINVPGKMTFCESDALSPGQNLVTSIEMPFGKMSIGICYDIRFPELALAASPETKLFVFPAAFNTVTGPMHWQLLMRARAVDQQAFVVAVSPARDPHASYQAYGHSLVVDPWGKVLVEADEHPTVLYADLDFSAVDEMRQQIPVLQQKRHDLYQLNVTK